MHGRLKVKSTAEQLEAKRKEREKKLKLYNGAKAKIFQKKQAGELDQELLMLTGEVLAVNPDFYSLWNYRKETFLELQKTRCVDDLQALLENELHFLEACLKTNPKSYGTWHHRCFVLDTLPRPDWKRELDLCNQFLLYDERNFHCWDYRRFVVRRAHVKTEEEFEFSQSKISSNFSNYSSWHYRSKLLPLIHPDPSQPMGVAEEALLREYELVQNGIFTDPDDQSNWFYHRWLLGTGERKQQISSICVSRKDNSIIVSLTKHIKLSCRCSLRVDYEDSAMNDVSDDTDDDSATSAKWLNHTGSKSFSTTWIADDLSLPEGVVCVKVSLVEDGKTVCSATLQLEKDEESGIFSSRSKAESSQFSQELSAVKSETLQQELESINQLMELETDNKWAVLTAVLLMKALNPGHYEESIMTHLANLEVLDAKRKNYYKDLRSKFIVETAIDQLDVTQSEITMSFKGRNLTKFYHPELLSFVHAVDLSSNRLAEVKHLSHLQNARELRLDDNELRTCQGLENMARLEDVSLRNNHISSVEDLKPLQDCRRLKTLNLEGNPICHTPALLQGVHEILPDVHVISNQS